MNWKTVFALVVFAVSSSARYCCPLTAKNTQSELTGSTPLDDTVTCRYTPASDLSYCEYSNADGKLLNEYGSSDVCRPSALKVDSDFCAYLSYPTRCCPKLENVTLKEFTETRPYISCKYSGHVNPCEFHKGNGKALAQEEFCGDYASFCPDDKNGNCEGSVRCSTHPGPS